MSPHTGFANPSPGLPTHMSAARGLSRGSGCSGRHPPLYVGLGNPSPGLPAHMSGRGAEEGQRLELPPPLPGSFPPALSGRFIAAALGFPTLSDFPTGLSNPCS